MLKFVSVVAVVLAVCYAQEAPKLEIPETFEAMVNIVATGRPGEQRMGKGEWYRSEILEDEKRSDTFTNGSGSFTFERLSLYKEHEEFMVEGTRCHKRELPEQFKFPMIWQDFEMRGHFQGKKSETVDNVTVELQDDHVELWAKVPEAEMPIKEPFAMKRVGRMGTQAEIFTSFVDTSPPETVFKAPESCEMATEDNAPQHPQRPMDNKGSRPHLPRQQGH